MSGQNTQRVLVTGGGSGIGSEIVSRLLDANYIVDFTYSSSPRQSGSHDGSAWKCDLSSPADVEQLLHAVSDEKYYALIHNAGTSYDSLIQSVSLERAQRLMQVNFWSFVSLIKAMTPSMMRSRSGRIVAIGSIASQKGNKGNSIYGASKAALCGLINNLAVETASRNVTANIVLPGYIDTPMLAKYDHLEKSVDTKVPLRKVGSAKDVSAIVRFLLSEDAAYVTGASLIVDGGMSVNG